MPEGKLDPFKLFKIFRGALGRKATGMLYLTDDQCELSIRLSHGQPVDIQSNQKTHLLGDALVHEGLISSTELRDLSERCRQVNASLVQIVLNEGFVARRRLQRIESRLAKARILPAFGWASGWFRFDPIALQEDPLIDPIDVISLIIEASATIVPTPLCDRFLKGFDGQELSPTPWFESYGGEFDRFFPAPNITRHVRAGFAISGIRDLTGSRAQLLRQGCAHLVRHV